MTITLKKNISIFETLPNEVFAPIMRRLRLQDLYRFSSTCKKAYSLLKYFEKSFEYSNKIKNKIYDKSGFRFKSKKISNQYLKKFYITHCMAKYKISAHQYVSFFLKNSGDVYAMGKTEHGEFGNKKSKIFTFPTKIKFVTKSKITRLYSSLGRLLCLSSNGNVFGTGVASDFVKNAQYGPKQIALPFKIEQIFIGTLQNIFIGKRKNRVFLGQLPSFFASKTITLLHSSPSEMDPDFLCLTNEGLYHVDGVSQNSKITRIESDHKITQICSGTTLKYILTEAGKVYALYPYKYFSNQQNRDAWRFELFTPLKTKKIIQITCGVQYNTALTQEGTVFEWKDSNDSEGNYKLSHIRLIPELNKVTAISTGTYHSLALTSDGEVYTWKHYDKHKNRPRIKHLVTPHKIGNL